MRHEASNVALAVANAGDIVHRAVGIARGIAGSICRGVTENYLSVLLELLERGFVCRVIAVRMRNRNFENLILRGGVRERRVGLLYTDVDMAADEAEAGIAHHRPGEQTRFEQNLKTVADAEN
ncbi:MAG: hypothetical protein AUH88_06255 [Acidobacteria bacterium 13_1_40CM_4_61_5]|nr:MAG: hypothetical protein AUH88_06255 [Acidobacteria bacterium 13_1_40CM_4_61_5]